METLFQSATQHAQSIARGDISSETLTDQYLNQIKTLNPKLNAIVALQDDRAKERARELDNLSREGKCLGPLHGVPITIKESINIKGLKTTLNFQKLKAYEPEHSGIIVNRLEAAGANIMGKSNVPMLLTDSQTFGPVFPTCNNPFDINRTPGGSTGGGASAIAAGMTTFEIGSDIGGSIRNPSHYCGLYGLKPTENGHVQDGHLPPMPQSETGFVKMVSTGPLARCMDDIELAYKIGFAPRWDYLQYLPVAHPLPHRDQLGDYTIGWYDDLGIAGSSTSTQKAMAKLVSRLEVQGAKVKRIQIDRKLLEHIYHVWASLFGFVVGHEHPWLIRQILRFKFGRDAKGAAIDVSPALAAAARLDFKAYAKTLRLRQEAIAELSRYFDEFDFVLSPTSAGPAFEHNHKHKPILCEGQQFHYVDYCFLFVMPYNALGHPVLTVPSGLNDDGLPIGIQVIGPHHTESQLIHFGKLLEADGLKFTRPPV